MRLQLFASGIGACYFARCNSYLLLFAPTLKPIRQQSAVMATKVKHIETGMYIAATAKGNDQMLVNPLTCEQVLVNRSDAMIARQLYYQLGFTESGWGYLSGGESIVSVDSLKFTKKAVCNDGGRVAVQDQVKKRVFWIDDSDVIKERETRTLQLNSKWELAFQTFTF